jgi:hypothetical protein
MGDEVDSERIKAESGIVLPMVNVLESTLEWTQGEVIVNSDIGSHALCLSLDSASAQHPLARGAIQMSERTVLLHR